MVGRLDGRIFDERTNVELNVGEVPDSVVVQGVQIALLRFGKGETSRIVIQPEYAFGAQGHAEFGVPSNTPVEYTVTLNHFEKENEAWKLDETDSIEQAKLYKEKGTGFFKAGEHKLAIKIYEKSNSYLSNCSEILIFRGCLDYY